MLTTLKNAFKVKEIKNRILFTLMILVVVRLGAQLPIPGVSRDVFAAWFEAQTGGAFNFFDQMTGGAFTQMSVFALNITPYITSSIIMQLMTIAIPKLEEMQKDGEDGRKKIREYTRYVTIALAVIEGLAMGIGLYRGGNLMHNNVLDIIMVTAALVADASLVLYHLQQVLQFSCGLVSRLQKRVLETVSLLFF